MLQGNETTTDIRVFTNLIEQTVWDGQVQDMFDN
jgi:hypothetical protein